MNFDDIIPFIIFLVYIAFMVLRKKPQKKNRETSGTAAQKDDKKKGFGLSRLVDTIKAELEKAALEARQRQKAAEGTASSPWDGYSDSQDDDDEDFDDSGQKADTFFPEPPPVLKKSKPPPPILKPRPVRSRDAFQERITPLFSYDDKMKYKKNLVLTPSKLREAVILSEILAKPVGLRD